MQADIVAVSNGTEVYVNTIQEDNSVCNFPCLTAIVCLLFIQNNNVHLGLLSVIALFSQG